MTKCIRLYSDGYVQIAKSETGVWFKRVYEKSPSYGYCWLKWEPIGQLIKVNRYIITYENLNGNEITEYKLKFNFSNSESGIYNYSHYFKLKDKCNVMNCKYRLPY